MNNFILINDDGSTYKCEPKLVKQISRTEVEKFTTHSSVSSKVEKSVLEIHPSRFNGMTHFPSALPNEQTTKNLPIYTVVDSGKKIIFSKIQQMYFSGNFSKAGHDPKKATLSSYSTSQSKGTLYNCTLPWSTLALAEKLNGMKIYFIPFATFSSKNTIYCDEGKDLSRADFICPSSPENGIANQFHRINNLASPDSPTLGLAMGIEGRQEAFFPLVSNVYDDLKVCLGRNRMIEVACIPPTEQEVFAFMLLSFLFSEFNSDLMAVEGRGSQHNPSLPFSKSKLLERIFCWDKDTLRYSPAITVEDVNQFAADHVTRKFALDIAKRALDATGEANV